MRVLQFGFDRSKRGVLFFGTASALRQEAYAQVLGHVDIVGFSLAEDGAREFESGSLAVYPTSSRSRWLYGLDALSIAKKLPKPDVVTAQDPFETGFIAWRAARHFGVPLHVQVHTDFLDPSYARHSRLNRLRVFVARFVLERAFGIRVVSERIKKSLRAASWRLRAEPFVLPIFVDVDRIRTLAPSPELRARFEHFSMRLLVVSRLESEKRVSLAVDSFARAHAGNACLIIVGEGSEREALERQAQELGVGDRAFFEGGVEAAPYFHLASLVLVPSSYEGYGLVIVEALAMGKPVLSTDVGVAREAEATLIAPPELFAEALQQWVANGPHEGTLSLPMPASFESYVASYCDDIKRLAR